MAIDEHIIEPLLPNDDSTLFEHIFSSSSKIGMDSKLPFVDPKGKLNIELQGIPKTTLYWMDLFHTLVNVNKYYFVALLLATYFCLFIIFAIPYYFESTKNSCIPGVYTFAHAFWFSVQTASSIGYGGDLVPNPDCFFTNLLVTFESVASLVVECALLGLVYARFSRPTRRASTLVFSKHMVLNEEDGVPRLTCRIANIRKHQLIETKVRMLVALNNEFTLEDESIFKFTYLPLLGGSEAFLGLPLNVTHAITSKSPLYGLSLAMMEKCDLEILVLLEGVDSSTSSKLQARHSYTTKDIKLNYRFATMVKRLPNGKRTVNFSLFNTLIPVPTAWTVSKYHNSIFSPILPILPPQHLPPQHLPPQHPLAPQVPLHQTPPHSSSPSSRSLRPAPLHAPVSPTQPIMPTQRVQNQDRTTPSSPVPPILNVPTALFSSPHPDPSASMDSSFDSIKSKPMEKGKGDASMASKPSFRTSAWGLGRTDGWIREKPAEEKEKEKKVKNDKAFPSLFESFSDDVMAAQSHGVKTNRERKLEMRHKRGKFLQGGKGEKPWLDVKRKEVQQGDESDEMDVTSALQDMEVSYAKKIVQAEEASKKWREMVVELAVRVQQCPALHQPDADALPLLECARVAMSKALAYDT